MVLHWISVTDSTRIIGMAYDVDAETIYVRFPDGKEWYYSACPPLTWEQFSAPGTSKGQFIAQVLNHKPNGRHVS